MMSPRPLLLAVLLCAPVVAMADEVPTVVQRDKQFSTDALIVPRGGAVSFVNQDTVRHNLAVQTPDGAERTGIVQAPGDVNRMSFDQPGLFQVHCLIHPQMRMTVQVR